MAPLVCFTEVLYSLRSIDPRFHRIYRKYVAPNLGKNPSHVQRTFIILLESGAAYCILQVMNAAHILPDHADFPHKKLATLVNHVRPHNTSNGADGMSDTQMQQILYSFAVRSLNLICPLVCLFYMYLSRLCTQVS